MRATNNQSRRVAAHDCQLRALELRKAGATYQAIAEQLGYAHAKGAYKAVTSALKLTLREPADALRELEVARLDAMPLPLWRRVQWRREGRRSRASHYGTPGPASRPGCADSRRTLGAGRKAAWPLT